MARFSVGAKTTGAGSATLPSSALAAPAGSGGVLREVGITNTTATACDVRLVRLTTAGTPGASFGTPGKHDPNSAAAALDAKQAYSSSAPTIGDLGYRASLGAAIGSGFIWTFPGNGLLIPAGTANAIGIIAADGSTLQLLQVYYVWDE